MKNHNQKMEQYQFYKVPIPSPFNLNNPIFEEFIGKCIQTNHHGNQYFYLLFM